MGTTTVTPITAARPDPAGLGQVLALVGILGLALVFLSPVLLAFAIWRGLDSGFRWAARPLRRAK